MLHLPVNIFNKHRHRAHRLYVAYYYRTPTPNNPVRYHTALISLPAAVAFECRSDSEATSSDSEGTCVFIPSAGLSGRRSLATKFHTVNVPVNNHGKGRVVWEYRAEKEDPYMAGTGLRMRLACLMFVGSVSSGRRLEKVLRKVEANKYADENPDYLCTTWLTEALSVSTLQSLLYSCTNYIVQLLVEEKMVDSLPCPPLDFWEIGARYADDWKEEHNSQMVASRMAIPCCDKDGNTLPTPMGAARE